MLYIISLWLTYFIIGILWLLTLSPISGNHLSVFCICKLIFFAVFFLDSTYKWYHLVFVSVWLFSLSITLEVHLCCSKWQDLILFKEWIMFHCVCVCVCARATHVYITVSHFKRLIICHWMLRLFPYCGFCK